MEKSICVSNSLNASTANRSFAPVHMQRLPAIHLDSWEFRKIAQEGSVMPNALITFDVDADGVEEVILGTTEGNLIVVKPDHRVPVYEDNLPATISVVLYSATHRRLVLITLEGQCRVTEGFVLPSSSSSSSLPCATSGVKLPISHSAPVFTSNPSGRGDHDSCYNMTNHARSQTIGSSVTFSIAPNCMCGDLGSDGYDEMLFIGSYDHRVYVYSLNGICLGSLFLEAPISSLKCFVVPLSTLSSTVEQMTKGCSNRKASQPPSAVRSQNEVTSSGVSTGLPMLLVSCSRRIVLLNASRADVTKWVSTDNSHSLSVQHERNSSLPVEGMKKNSITVSQNRLSTLEGPSPRTGNGSTYSVQEQLCPIETSLSDDEDVEQQINTLQPVWQMHMDPANPGALSPTDDELSRGRSCSTIPSRIFSYEPPSAFYRRDSSEYAMQRGVSSMLSIHEGQFDVTQDLRFPVAVDVAVGQSCAQFTAASEDGRCYILEMCIIGAEAGNDHRLSTGGDCFDHSPKVRKTTAKVVSIGGPEMQLEASIRCTWAGLLKQQSLVSRVRVFCMKNNEFCSVFVTTNGMCYALDSGGGIAIESHVKADASSFAIMAGGSTTHPMRPLVCPASNTAAVSCARDSAIGGNVLQRQKQNLLRGPVGRVVSLVCVTVDELVISSVGGESYLSAPTSVQMKSSPLTPSHPLEHKRSVELGYVDIDDTLSQDDEEEALMLQLGTLLMEAGGYADPQDLFTEEDRRHIARKLCAYGYSHTQWKMLEQMAESFLD